MAHSYRLSLIVAVADNQVIGRQNSLPWRAPADLARFKQLTMGKPMIMGRKTFDSLGRVLPGRPHIVISRQSDLGLPPQCYLAASLQDAIEIAKPLMDASQEIMVIGGAEIYRQALALADRIYLTQVHLEPEGDAFFSPLGAEWQELEKTRAEGEPACSYLTYGRREPVR
ncbi:Dihydrofolate reductase (FolA) [gamma proteobacterium HdN1]|nr:Dihydrofolate reductase (FolA) [gamma proteobacterium HdN1]